MQRAAKDCKMLQRAAKDCKRLQKAVKGCKELQRAAKGWKGLQGLKMTVILKNSTKKFNYLLTGCKLNSGTPLFPIFLWVCFDFNWLLYIIRKIHSNTSKWMKVSFENLAHLDTMTICLLLFKGSLRCCSFWINLAVEGCMEIVQYLKSHHMKALYIYFVVLYSFFMLYYDFNFKNRTYYQCGFFSKVKIGPYLVNVGIIKLIWFNEKTKFLAVFIPFQSKGFNYYNQF